ncbi:MAG: c-type cytochrome [Chloroflexi bacterium]|nr:c-type cytochrome [Chloroflexota bacterium]
MKLFQALVFALMLMLMTTGIFATVSAQGDAARGKDVYLKNCAVCHGDRGQGRIGATLAKEFPSIRQNALVKEIISNGVAGSVMSAWAKGKGGPLSDAEIDDLVAFVNSLGRQAPTAPTGPTATPAPLPPPPPSFPPGDATRGTKVYAENCAVCHGERGEGRVGATLQKEWSGIDPEKFLDATIARGVAGSRMPAWAKFAGGPLSEQEIADSAAYIRTLKPARTVATVAPSTQIPTGGDIGGPLALACTGLLVVAGVIVLGLGLAGSRNKK